MAILDRFKREKREIEKKKQRESIEERIEAKINKNKEEIYEVEPRKVKEKRVSEAWKILKSPQITEKAADLASRNQYTFKVYSQANKIEIKKAIEDLYGVDVLSVNIIKIPRKQRRLGRISGWRKGYKKAIVKIKEGQKIELLPR